MLTKYIYVFSLLNLTQTGKKLPLSFIIFIYNFIYKKEITKILEKKMGLVSDRFFLPGFIYDPHTHSTG